MLTYKNIYRIKWRSTGKPFKKSFCSGYIILFAILRLNFSTFISCMYFAITYFLGIRFFRMPLKDDVKYHPSKLKINEFSKFLFHFECTLFFTLIEPLFIQNITTIWNICIIIYDRGHCLHSFPIDF